MKTSFFLVILFLLTGCYQAKNFHEIDEGKYYRSAQLSGKEFSQAIEDLGIKTIINLRGVSDDSWFKEEQEVAQRYNINHINISMSAKRLPHRDDLIKLLDAFKNAERPILIHCQGGADRTGEASAIYQMLYMSKTKFEALDMLTIKYFHLKARMPAKRYFIKEIWQGEDWVYSDYDPCKGEYQYYDINSPECQEGFSEVVDLEDDT